MRILHDAVTGQAFKPWEVSDNLPRIKLDRALRSNEVRAVELLHEAAYRNGLGNSVFCPKDQVGKLSSETLQHFFATNCTTNRCAVAGINVDHKYLVGFAQSLGLESGEGHKNDSKFHGGADARKERGGRTAAVAVATNGSSLSNPQEALAAVILQHAGGCGPATKRGSLNGALTKVIAGAAPDVSATTFNALYTDNGLFGFVANGCSRQIGKAVEAGIKTLKSCSPNDDDIARGKATVKAQIAEVMETESKLIDALSSQSCLIGNVSSLQKAMEAVDAVSNADVKSVSWKFHFIIKL